MRYRLGNLGDDTTSTDTTDTGPGGAAAPGWLQTLITGATQLELTQQSISNAQQINAINIQRAAAGLPPINPPLTSGPTVNVGLSQNTQTLLLYGALAVGALILVNTLLKR